MKFQIASDNLTNATNAVYAECTVPDTFYSIAKLIDINDLTSIIPTASRGLGTWFSKA